MTDSSSLRAELSMAYDKWAKDRGALNDMRAILEAIDVLLEDGNEPNLVLAEGGHIRQAIRRVLAGGAA